MNTVPFTMWEITRIDHGATAHVVVRPITVTAIESTIPDRIRFTDADGIECRGRFSHYYESEDEARADLEHAA